MLKSAVEWNIVINTRTIRKKFKKTQRDIANILSVSSGYIGQIESENFPAMYSYDQLNELAKFFNCSMRDFMPERPL